MIVGGNPAFKEFLDYYGIRKTTPIRTIYRTRAAEFYREMLNIFAQDKPFGKAFPDKDEGKKLNEEEFKESESRYSTEISGPRAYTAESRTTDESEGSWLTKVYDKVRETGNKMYEKVEEFGETPTMKRYEGEVLNVIDHVEKGIGVCLDEVTDRIWKPSDSKRIPYFEIATSPYHTFDKINADSRSQQIKLESMNMLKSMEKGEILEEKSRTTEETGQKFEKEYPKFEGQNKNLSKQVELGERTY